VEIHQTVASYRLAALVAFLFALVAPSAQAAVILTAVETGTDVVFTVEAGSSLNLDAWTKDVEPGDEFGRIQPNTGVFMVGKVPADSIDQYSNPLNFMGPSGGNSFGTGGSAFGSSGFGGATCQNPTRDCGLLGLIPGGQFLRTPFDYVSGEMLPNSTTTYAGEDFASLGLDVGMYTWTWGSGGTADSLTLNIVPEPSTAALMTLGLIGLAARRRQG
jgi:hypothetical protein